MLRATRRGLAIVVLANLVGPAAARAQDVPEGYVEFFAGRLTSDEPSSSHRLLLRELMARAADSDNLSGPPRAVDVLVLIDSPELGDLDLVVASAPDARDGCASAGRGGREQCRWTVRPDASLVWMDVSLFDGVGETGYSIFARPIAGPRLGETGLWAGESTETFSGVPVQVVFRQEEELGPRSVGQVLQLPDPPTGHSLVVVDQAGPALDLLAFDGEGRPVGEVVHGLSIRSEPWQLPAEARFVVLRAETMNAPEAQIQAAHEPLRYQVAVMGAALPRPVVVGGDGFRTSGRSSQAFSFTLSAGEAGLVTLVGRDTQLEVTATTAVGLEVVRTFSPTGTGIVQVAHVGAPLDEAGIVSGPLGESGVRVTVSVTPGERRGAYPEPEWRLELRQTLPLRPRVLLRYDAAALEDLPPASQRARSVDPRERPMLVWRLPIPTDYQRMTLAGAQVPPYRANLRQGNQSFDIAVVNELGEVVDIDEQEVAWNWPQDAGSLLLVVFPAGVATGGSVNLSIDLVMPAGTSR